MGNDNPHLLRKALIAVKEEASEGVAEELVADDFTFLVYDLKPSPDIAKFVRQPTNLGDLGTVKPVIGSRASNVSFRTEVKGGGHATDKTNKPEFVRLLNACGGYVSEALSEVAIASGTGTAVDGDTFQKQGEASHQITVLKGGDLSALAAMEFVLLSGSAPATGETWEKVGEASINFTVDTGGTTADTGLLTRPSSDASKSATVGVHFVYDVAAKKATRLRLRGTRGGLSLVANDPDEPVFLAFTPEGGIEDYTDVEVPVVAPTYDAMQPLPFLGVGLTFLGFTPVFQNLTFDWNAKLARRKDANNPAGIYATRITTWDPRGKINPELVPQAGSGSFDFYQAIVDQVEGSTGFTLDNGETGGFVEFYCPLITLEDMPPEDVDGIVAIGAAFGAHRDLNGAIDRFAMFITRG